jgi:hypothetical protein
MPSFSRHLLFCSRPYFISFLRERLIELTPKVYMNSPSFPVIAPPLMPRWSLSRTAGEKSPLNAMAWRKARKGL